MAAKQVLQTLGVGPKYNSEARCQYAWIQNENTCSDVRIPWASAGSLQGFAFFIAWAGYLRKHNSKAKRLLAKPYDYSHLMPPDVEVECCSKGLGLKQKGGNRGLSLDVKTAVADWPKSVGLDDYIPDDGDAKKNTEIFNLILQLHNLNVQIPEPSKVTPENRVGVGLRPTTADFGGWGKGEEGMANIVAAHFRRLAEKEMEKLNKEKGRNGTGRP